MTSILAIGNSHYYVSGNPEAVTEVANICGLKFDSIEDAKISPFNGIFKVWGVGELADYLAENERKVGN